MSHQRNVPSVSFPTQSANIAIYLDAPHREAASGTARASRPGDASPGVDGEIRVSQARGGNRFAVQPGQTRGIDRIRDRRTHLLDDLAQPWFKMIERHVDRGEQHLEKKPALLILDLDLPGAGLQGTPLEKLPGDLGRVSACGIL